MGAENVEQLWYGLCLIKVEDPRFGSIVGVRDSRPPG
jgi:hypothetical protein